MAVSSQVDSWRPEWYDRYSSRDTLRLARRVLETAQKHLAPESRLLDIGCGDGLLTVVLQDQCSQVVGVDKSPAMVNAARKRGCSDVREADGSNLQAAGIGAEEFDLIFSNDAIHAAILYVSKRYRPDGQMISPWYFPTAEEYREVLERNGFRDCQVEVEAVVVPLSISLREFLESVLFGFVADWADAPTQKKIFDEVEEIVGPVVCRHGVFYCENVYLHVLAYKA
ncbi:hypothetical protein H4R33_002411 [Dimargaris cristalligena]|uniref:S-adenosyl-L-methionine-dependent methyltransferase n=1 Tax=Dimargaris cristalligena TaxID=215637 RepID=A0A4P9ZVW2_9FUNG|nr:hypothetical protein H4R33_002411 [Dimargaris cristalligena]RKP37737.1 S-adenosyl-L-methionine-dependent methyltransferase [Dimargaris cristalligena]|eukprot:RKP37737.1 S-adenosyl-L-methionine-dependent methyltransferase [Dimargaris cristalligena]